jgi:hypothetical protein
MLTFHALQITNRNFLSIVSKLAKTIPEWPLRGFQTKTIVTIEILTIFHFL